MTNESSEGRSLSANESLAEDIYLTLFDDVLFGLLLQVHRAARLGYLFYLDPDSDSEFDKQYEIYEENDVLGAFSHLNENFKVSSKINFFYFFSFTFFFCIKKLKIFWKI